MIVTAVCLALGLTASADAAQKPIEPVELTGKVEDFYFNRNWSILLLA